jgi:hypothetical protein
MIERFHHNQLHAAFAATKHTQIKLEEKGNSSQKLREGILKFQLMEYI